MKCRNCGAEIADDANFCTCCAKKQKEVCNCWVKKEPYNCGLEKCPGYRLLEIEKSLGKEARTVDIKEFYKKIKTTLRTTFKRQW